MKNSGKIIRTGIINIFILIALVLVTNTRTYSHKDKPHTDADTSSVDTGETPNDSVSAVMDSIYQLIQNGYTDLQPLFQRGCYDCHSDQTNYPWYYKLPGIKGTIDDDITEARKHLDMSQGFPFLGHGEPNEDLEAIKKVLKEGDMPPFKYRILHWNARFSDEEVKTVTSWIDKSLKRLAENKLPRSTTDNDITGNDKE